MVHFVDLVCILLIRPNSSPRYCVACVSDMIEVCYLSLNIEAFSQIVCARGVNAAVNQLSWIRMPERYMS